MSRTRTWTRKLLLGTTVAVTSLALSACCKDSKEEATTEATPEPEPAETAEPEEPEELKTTDPEWKTKCPDAERPESGTVTAKINLQIYKEPKTDSEKLSSISSGTWVNLLGAKGTWYCIDYPCDVGKLCPGWIEARYSKRKETVPETKDAGTTETKDAGATETKDAGTTETKTDAGRKIRIPRFRIKDAGSKSTGTGTKKPGGRPGSIDNLQPPR